MHPLWFYKHQHDNQVRSKLFVACQLLWFQWRFWLVPSVPGYLREEEKHKPDPWRNPIERNHMGFHLENEVASYKKNLTIISNNPVLSKSIINKISIFILESTCFGPILINNRALSKNVDREINIVTKNTLTYSMVHSHSWEANWFAASQEIPRISRNPKVHYRTHKCPPSVSILGQPNPVHIPTTHLLEIHPNSIHTSMPRSPQWYPSLRFP